MRVLIIEDEPAYVDALTVALEREGYVERIRGKGTFVREPRVELSVAWHLLGFTEDLRRVAETYLRPEFASTAVVSNATQLESRGDTVASLGLKVEQL